MTYQTAIHEIDSSVNPAGVEAAMRLQNGTLDHLSRWAFAAEVRLAVHCELEKPGYLRRAAESMGFDADFERWERELNG